MLTLTDYLTGDKDEEDELAGSLVKDKRTVNSLISRSRELIGLASESASNGFSTFRDIGISNDLSGKISINESVYSTALKTNFSDIRTMLTGDTNDQPATSLANRGLALQSSAIFNTMIDTTGSITTGKVNARTIGYEIYSGTFGVARAARKFKKAILGTVCRNGGPGPEEQKYPGLPNQPV